MALDPRIALGGIQPTFSLFDLGATLRTGQQLQAGRLALTEEQRQQQAAEALRQAYRQEYGGGAPTGLAGALPGAPAGPDVPVQERQLGGGPSAAFPGGPAQPLPYTQGATPVDPRQARGPGVALPTPPPGPEAMTPPGQPQGLAGQAPADSQGQRAFVSKLYTIDPKAAMEYENHLTATTRAQSDAQEAQMKANVARVEFLGRVADGVLESGNPQQAWEVARAMLREQGMPESQLPAVYDPSYVRQLSGMARDAKDKYNEGMLRLQQSKEQRERTEAGGKVPNYGLGQEANAVMHEMFGAQLPPGSAPTPAMTQRVNAELIRREREADAARQQGRVDVAAATGEKAARLQLEAKPLEGEAAKAVSQLTTLQQMTDDVTDLFSTDYTGQFSGRWGAVKQWTGNASQREVVFRRVVEDMKDQLLRARSGAAITQQEYERLSGLVPGLTDPPTTFQARLLGFRRGLDQARAARLETATTSRGQLRQQSPEVTPLPPGGAGKRTSRPQIQQKLKQGWTLDQAVDYYRSQGWEVTD